MSEVRGASAFNRKALALVLGEAAGKIGQAREA
jgi:hypothetical protein